MQKRFEESVLNRLIHVRRVAQVVVGNAGRATLVSRDDLLKALARTSPIPAREEDLNLGCEVTVSGCALSWGRPWLNAHAHYSGRRSASRVVYPGASICLMILLQGGPGVVMGQDRLRCVAGSRPLNGAALAETHAMAKSSPFEDEAVGESLDREPGALD